MYLDLNPLCRVSFPVLRLLSTGYGPRPLARFKRFFTPVAVVFTAAFVPQSFSYLISLTLRFYTVYSSIDLACQLLSARYSQEARNLIALILGIRKTGTRSSTDIRPSPAPSTLFFFFLSVYGSRTQSSLTLGFNRLIFVNFCRRIIFSSFFSFFFHSPSTLSLASNRVFQRIYSLNFRVFNFS